LNFVFDLEFLPMNIFWFRRDLRLDDNVGLFHALNSSEDVLPIFIFDDAILSQLPKDDARVTFIHQQLEHIQMQLQSIGKSLAVFHGKPIEVYQQLIAENNIKSVYTNHDYEPYARKRDLELYQLFKEKDIEFKTSKDQVVFEKSEVVKDDGSPYVVYTPYSNKWKENFKKIKLIHYNSEALLDKITHHSYPFLSLNDIGFVASNIQVTPYDVSNALIDNYEATRNFPALNKTSYLGIYLRFGAVSIRKMIAKAIESKNETFFKELIWREFFMQILWHFPHTNTSCFRPKYDTIKWDNNEELFRKWCEGKTGYPFVDAGMRELNATGHMHNRVRMITASFLCKHLLIDWRWGETYFATKLLDYEQASNVGNWQWAAGSGVDAAPYFRIFNPTEQIKKFDKDLKYIKKWIPELESFDYPKPIVDHKEARERCLRVYKEAVG
jgi:deoxyribodipyrimidine photo-lyase